MRGGERQFMSYCWRIYFNGVVKLMHLAAITRQKGSRRDLRSSLMRQWLSP